MATDDEDLEGQEPTDPSELVKHLRAQIKQRNSDLADAKAAKRELAFVKAGIDTSTKLGQLFAKSFEGDVADIEAVKAEAKELGLIQEPAAPTTTTETTATTEPPAPPDGSATERSNLANGAVGDDGSGVDPRQTAMARAEEALKQGATYEHAAGGFIAELAKAAIGGDPRVIIQGQHY